MNVELPGFDEFGWKPPCKPSLGVELHHNDPCCDRLRSKLGTEVLEHCRIVRQYVRQCFRAFELTNEYQQPLSTTSRPFCGSGKCMLFCDAAMPGADSEKGRNRTLTLVRPSMQSTSTMAPPVTWRVREREGEKKRDTPAATGRGT